MNKMKNCWLFKNVVRKVMLLSYLTGVVYVTATSDLMFLKLYVFLNFIMTDCVLFSPHFILIFFFLAVFLKILKYQLDFWRHVL